MYDYITTKPPIDEALMHYGVMGMKWGVRKDPERAYTKAQKKHNKYTKKIEKTNKKYLKEAGKISRFFGRKRALRKVVRLNAKNDYLVNKQKKWDDSVSKNFSKEYDRIKKIAQTGEEKDIKLSKLEKAYNNYWNNGNHSDFLEEFKKKKK